MHAVFLFSGAKEAVEVIEVSDVIMSTEFKAAKVFRTTQILTIINILARVTFILIFEKKTLFKYAPGISVKFCPPAKVRLWRTGMLLLIKSKGNASNFH